MDLYLNIAAKLLIGLITLMVIIRLMGNKELAQVTPLDMAFIVILADLVAGISTASDLDSGHLIFSMAFWSILIFLLEMSTRKSKKFNDVVQGEPSIIIRDGEMDIDTMQSMRLTEKEILALLRGKGVFDVNNVEIAFIEVSGSISVKTKGR